MNLETASDVLTKRGWLSKLPRELRRDWLSGAKLQNLAKGETLFNLDDDANFMFGIADGTLGAYLSYSPEETRLMMLICEGVWAGDPTVMSSERRRGTVIARTDCTLLIVLKSHVEDVSARHPEIWRWISRNLVVQFDSFMMISAATHHRDPAIRLIMTLSGIGRLNEGHESFEVTTEEIGFMANLSRNTAGKCLAQLERTGLVERGYANIRVRDRIGLSAELRERLAA